MSTISRLPESTSRLLGPPVTIATPVGLVKELVDNAIDARATSIEVILSADTVQKIEVRDNGSGIHPDDHDALGRRGHTSKLRSFEELRTRFGNTLGFRGEALASANSLGQVTVTTKIASEPVAAVLHIRPGTGGVSEQKPTSAPTGTTVSVTDLFGRLPVRKRVAIRDSAKAVDRVREVLRSYTMARPQLKFSLKVLQAPRQSWSYSPKLNATAREASAQLFGVDLTNSCIEKTFQAGVPVGTSQPIAGHHDYSPDDCYIFDALIQKPGSDSAKAPGRRYISIDGRPIDAKRNVCKKISSIYIEHISPTFPNPSSVAVPKGGFIRLNIKCPSASYDANVEPSKDDVLFSDENLVLDGFKKLCVAVYKTSTADDIDSLPQAALGTNTHNGDNLGTRETRPVEAMAEFNMQEASYSPPSLQLRNLNVSGFEPRGLLGIPGLQSRSCNLQRTGINISVGHSAPAWKKPLTPEEVTGASHAPCKFDMLTDLSRRTYGTERPRPIQTPPNPRKRRHIIVECPRKIAKMITPGRGRREEATNESSYEDVASMLPICQAPTTPESSVTSESPIALESPVTPDSPVLGYPKTAPKDLDVPTAQRNLPSQRNYYYPPGLITPDGPCQSPTPTPSGVVSPAAVDDTLARLTHKPHDYYSYPSQPPTSPTEKTQIRPRDTSGYEHYLVLDSMRQETMSLESVNLDGSRPDQSSVWSGPDLDNQSLESYPPQSRNGARYTTAGPRVTRLLNNFMTPLEVNDSYNGQTRSLVQRELLTVEVLHASMEQGARFDRYAREGIYYGAPEMTMNLAEGREIEERLRTLIRAVHDRPWGEGEPEIGLCRVLKGKWKATSW